MSQAGIINVSGGGGGGSPIQTITGNDNVAVPPTANNIFLLGASSTANNVNGITTSGNAGTSTETISLTNRLKGSVTTIGAVTNTIITFPLSATPGTYTIELRVSGFEATAPSSTSYFEFICAASTGAVARIVSAGDSDEICLEDAALNASDVLISASGNSVLIQVLGVVGLTIDWVADGLYTFAS